MTRHVAKSTDFKEITPDNYSTIMREFEPMYYYLLKRFGAYHDKRFYGSALRFFEFLWQRRENFDRRKSRLSTWMAFIVREFVQYERRAIRNGIPPEEMADYHRKTVNGSGRRRRQVHLFPSGLNPQVIPDQLHDEIDTGAEKVDPSVDYSFDDELHLRQLMATLPAIQRHVMDLKEAGFTEDQMAAKLNVERWQIWTWTKAARKTLKELRKNGQDSTAKRKAKWNFGSAFSIMYWQEYFKTYRESFPRVVYTRAELDSLPTFRR